MITMFGTKQAVLCGNVHTLLTMLSPMLTLQPTPMQIIQNNLLWLFSESTGIAFHVWHNSEAKSIKVNANSTNWYKYVQSNILLYCHAHFTQLLKFNFLNYFLFPWLQCKLWVSPEGYKKRVTLLKINYVPNIKAKQKSIQLLVSTHVSSDQRIGILNLSFILLFCSVF